VFISHPEVIDFETHFTDYESTLRVKNNLPEECINHTQFRNKDELALELAT